MNVNTYVGMRKIEDCLELQRGQATFRNKKDQETYIKKEWGID